MPDNEQTQDAMAPIEASEPDTSVDVVEQELIEVPVPDPEPNPVQWAVSELSVRAISSPDDLQDGETLVTGERPLAPEQRADAMQQKVQLLALATENIAPLQDAVDLEEATDEEVTELKGWKKYRVLLNRLDVSTAPDIEWPIQPVI